MSDHYLPDQPLIVLVVEDEDLVRQMVARVLGEQGYRTLEARHGEEALQMVRLAYPYLHLVVTDVLMPELDGRQLGHRLREAWPGLPVLYISAYPADDLFHRGAPSASAPFLQKPFSAETLLSAVRQLLPVADPSPGAAFAGNSGEVPAAKRQPA